MAGISTHRDVKVFRTSQ